MKKKLLLFLFAIITVQSIYSNSCSTSAGSFASWAALTWTCTSSPTSGPPGCGDVMNISAGTTVQISADVDYSGCASPITLNIFGTMNFTNGGVRFKLPPGSTVFVASGGTLMASFSGGGSSTLISIGGVNVWTAGSGTITGPMTLPIELLSFTAAAGSDRVILNWSTASETGNDFYTIEKTLDGSTFEYVATVDGAGNSTSVLNYVCEDKNPTVGISYYRLKQTDFNGLSMGFDLVAVEYIESNNFSFNVFPNPNNGVSFNMSLSYSLGEEILVVIMDALGRECYSKVIITNDNSNNIYALYPSSKLSPGMYFISASCKQEAINKKLIVK